MAAVAGAVLAAGAGTRMGTPKADLVVAGRRLLDRAVTALRTGGCNPIIAVVREGTTVGGARAVVNPDPVRGLRSSLSLAVDAAELAHADALAVIPVDEPGIGPDAVRTATAAWRPGQAVVATYRSRRSFPIVMAASLWREVLAAAEPDEDGERWLLQHPDIVDEVAVRGDPTDLDTRTDLRNWTGG